MQVFSLSSPILVTCGLPYANGPCHLGHLRTYVPADIFVRGMRRMGKEVLFVCGSDAHGTPIVVNAEAKGMTPKELVAKYHSHFDEVFRGMGVNFDFFGDTDDPACHNRTQEMVRALMEKGYVYPKEIELAYCPKCERFLPDRYVEGECPYCGKPARGDECDQGCGRHLEPGEIKNAVCKICGGKADYRTQTHYFFRLSQFKEFLLEYLKTLGGTASARNYALEWVRQELKDWCITRNMSWGVKFPGHNDLVVYVWVDAPIGYIAFTEEWCARKNADWQKYWKDDAKIIHFIGGDIVYHHCIFWPAMLKGAGYTLPSAVVASGMLKIDDKKFSKSRGNVIWVKDDYLDRGLHPDLLRYYLASYTSHNKEVNFSWKIFAEKVNTELVGAFGNFLNRALTFTAKNFDGRVPDGDVDAEVAARIKQTLKEVRSSIEEYEFKKAADSIMALADYGNIYFQSREPWKLIKVDKEKAGVVLKNCLQIAKALVVLMQPFMPSKMEEAWRQLGLDGRADDIAFDEALVILRSGQPLGKPEILFQRMEEAAVKDLDSIFKERIREAESKERVKSVEKKGMISFDEFQALDLRVGEIKEAGRIKGSDKLLKLDVDIGGETRQVVAGIAGAYECEDLVGMQVVVLTNLEPAKLFGVESQAMLLAADVAGKAVLLRPSERVETGTRVR
ncbi:MAG: Methionine--tRNA ligase [Methanosaeta sp. PtaU1.Bin060]|nr:MAG: Methionine--tRNA ligase [Methanosaeta sp. PtaU1.Bin060]